MKIFCLAPTAIALSLSVGLALTSPALGGDAFHNPVQSQVLQGWDMPDGRRLAAVQLTLDPGWKTYWRAPGDAGIPPHFDWGRARNIAQVSINWPTPDVYFDNGLRSIGYMGRLVIPMHLTPQRPDKPMRLRTRMLLGICAEVCVPHKIDIDTMLDAPDLSPTPAIVAALASMPYSQDEAGVHNATCAISPTADGMQIKAQVSLPHTGGTEVAVIETGAEGLWISEAITTRRGDTITAVSQMVHADGGAFAIDRSAVRITIIGGDYAVDVRGCTAG